MHLHACMPRDRWGSGGGPGRLPDRGVAESVGQGGHGSGGTQGPGGHFSLSASEKLHAETRVPVRSRCHPLSSWCHPLVDVIL